MYRPGQAATDRRICFDVDMAFCISLTEREDRRKLFLETVGPRISNPIDFFITERCDDPVRGCYESHQAIARLVLDHDWERVLVFEDDAQPYGIRFTQGWWINSFIRRNRFQALHLGYSMGRTWMTWFPFIARGNVVALHAYIISREGCRVLVDTPYCGVPVDVMFKLSMKQHCAYPMLYRQHAAAVAGSNILASAVNEDDWWQRNWKKHQISLLKNCWRTLFRIRF